MIAAGSGLTTGTPPVEAARAAARSAMERSGLGEADLALVFMTADAYRLGHEAMAEVRRVTGARLLLGCSAAGVLTEAGEAEAGPAIAVLAARTRADLELTPVAITDRDALDADAGAELRAAVGQSVHDRGALVVLPDPVTLDPNGFLLGFSERLDPAPIFGGVAAGMPVFELHDTRVLHGALTGVTVSERPVFGIGESCQPIGEPLVVTAAEANTIQAIASRRPMDVLREAIESLPDHHERVSRFGVFAGLAVDLGKSPLVRGDFVVRPIVGADQNTGAISLPEAVFPGQTIQFQVRDAEAAREDLDAMLTRVNAALHGRTPSFGLYFNCSGRGQGLYGETSYDVDQIRARLGDWPLIGFFGNGEFAPIGLENVLHTYSGVLVVFPQR